MVGWSATTVLIFNVMVCSYVLEFGILLWLNMFSNTKAANPHLEMLYSLSKVNLKPNRSYTFQKIKPLLYLIKFGDNGPEMKPS